MISPFSSDFSLIALSIERCRGLSVVVSRNDVAGVFPFSHYSEYSAALGLYFPAPNFGWHVSHPPSLVRNLGPVRMPVLQNLSLSHSSAISGLWGFREIIPLGYLWFHTSPDFHFSVTVTRCSLGFGNAAAVTFFVRFSFGEFSVCSSGYLHFCGHSLSPGSSAF